MSSAEQIKQVRIDAIERIKASSFTAGDGYLKVELEAQFNRNNANECCEDCDEGWNQCVECYGENTEECDECNGEGTMGTARCDNCEGTGTWCCEFCEDGYVRCGTCEGDWQAQNDGWSNEVCHDWIMERLQDMGLAETTPDAVCLSHGVVTLYKPINELVYGEFYNDGSVDSEFTFTLSLKDPARVLELLPKIVDVFWDLGQEIGNDVDVAGAGMHMAVLQSDTGAYPHALTTQRESDAQYARFENFSREMEMLLPALYFLGSNNEKSRGLRFRIPRVSCSDKYSTIAYRGGSLEFRVFETVYDNPDAILDNLVVIANCLDFWTDKPKKVNLKCKKEILFGTDYGDQLSRFYQTADHLDVLREGLKVLKPAYYTLTDLKKQRKFHINRRSFMSKLEQARREAEAAYKEYEERFKWSLVVEEYKQKAYWLEVLPKEERGKKDYMGKLDEKAKEYIAKRKAEKQKRKSYVDKKLEQYQIEMSGQYRLAERNR